MRVRHKVFKSLDEAIPAPKVKITPAGDKELTYFVRDVFGEIHTGLRRDCRCVVVDRSNQRIEHERLKLAVKTDDGVVVQPRYVLLGLSIGSVGQERHDFGGCYKEILCGVLYAFLTWHGMKVDCVYRK